MKKKKSTIERGKFKKEIHAALYKSNDIREMLLGDVSGKTSSQIQNEFKEHVKSHLFLEDTVTETDMFIFYDVIMPELHPNIKECRIIMYVICHRDKLDDYIPQEGYYGNRVDVLSEMVEDALLDEDVVNKFGIGELTLDSVGIYNATRFYGCIMEFVIPTFR